VLKQLLLQLRVGIYQLLLLRHISHVGD